MRKLAAMVGVVAAGVLSALTSPLAGQTPAFSIDPMRMEMEVNPGTEKTAAFEIKAAPSQAPERGRLVLSLADWTIKEDGSVTFSEAGSLERSASPWIIFSPAAITLEPGRVQTVRVTAKVPQRAQPGVYRAAIFVQERPEATPPPDDQRVILLRVRYAFTLYVVVPPVAAHPELVNLDVDTSSGPLHLICEMKNTGSRHVRPLINWTIRRSSAAEAEAKGRIETTVLLPLATLREPFSLQHITLSPGRYEASVVVDFQDGQPLQSMTRNFEVAEPAPGPSTGTPSSGSEGTATTADYAPAGDRR